ncbi:MAG: SirB2 family protein [Woeseiaceae bacterium]
MYATLKLIHVSAAILTISGFALRGFWRLVGSTNLQLRLVRIAPHVIDTIFLLSGIGLIMSLRLQVLDHPWLITKLVALVVYVLLGTMALKRGKTANVRLGAFLLALATFAYIVGVALNKSVWSWFVE